MANVRYAAMPQAEKSRQDVGKRPRLSLKEELALVARMSSGDTEARDTLIMSNLGLVWAIARRYAKRVLVMALDDMVSAGTVGLISATDRFDTSFKTRFATFATACIRQEIREAVINTGSTIRVPKHLHACLMRWQRAEAALGEVLGRPPIFDEVADAMKLTPLKRRLVSQAQHSRRIIREITQWRWRDRGEPDEPFLLLSEVPSCEPGDDSNGVDDDDYRELHRQVSRLDARARTILTSRMGLGGAPLLTLRELGDQFNLTKERIRQIEAATLQRIREEWGDQTKLRAGRKAYA